MYASFECVKIVCVCVCMCVCACVYPLHTYACTYVVMCTRKFSFTKKYTYGISVCEIWLYMYMHMWYMYVHCIFTCISSKIGSVMYCKSTCKKTKTARHISCEIHPNLT